MEASPRYTDWTQVDVSLSLWFTWFLKTTGGFSSPGFWHSLLIQWDLFFNLWFLKRLDDLTGSQNKIGNKKQSEQKIKPVSHWLTRENWSWQIWTHNKAVPGDRRVQMIQPSQVQPFNREKKTPLVYKLSLGDTLSPLVRQWWKQSEQSGNWAIRLVHTLSVPSTADVSLPVTLHLLSGCVSTDSGDADAWWSRWWQNEAFCQVTVGSNCI